jgi:hypothetical protein
MKRMDPAALEPIVRIEAVRRRAGESALGKALRAERSLQEAREAILNERSAREAAWAAATGAARLDLALAGSWAHAVREADIELAVLAGRIGEAAEASDRGRARLATAMAREEVAVATFTQALVHARARREEQSMAEAADREARRGGARP